MVYETYLLKSKIFDYLKEFKPSDDLGRAFLKLQYCGWDNNHHLNPFLPVNKNTVFNFYERNKKYKTLSEEILKLTKKPDYLENFLIYFHDEVIVPFIAQVNPDAAPYANGWYIATFFLMIAHPTEHLVRFRKPLGVIENHPLVIAGIDANLVNAAQNAKTDVDSYHKLIIAVVRNLNGFNGNFIEFIATLEKQQTDINIQ